MEYVLEFIGYRGAERDTDEIVKVYEFRDSASAHEATCDLCGLMDEIGAERGIFMLRGSSCPGAWRWVWEVEIEPSRMMIPLDYRLWRDAVFS